MFNVLFINIMKMKMKILVNTAVFGLCTIILSGCSSSDLADSKVTGKNIGENQNSEISKYDLEAQQKRQKELLANQKQTQTGTVPQEEKPKQVTKKTMELAELATLDFKDKYKGAEIKTSLGTIEVEFYGADSPATVNNFMKLASEGFYNNTKFHRVMEDFMIQGGDQNSKNDDAPNTWGTGDPGYSFPDEINSHKLVSGSLAMANSGPNTNGSQFFIVTKEETSWLDGKHTNFGFVTKGMDVVRKIEITPTLPGDRPVEPVIIEGVTLIEK